jgi:hypothetical protein
VGLDFFRSGRYSNPPGRSWNITITVDIKKNPGHEDFRQDRQIGTVLGRVEVGTVGESLVRVWWQRINNDSVKIKFLIFFFIFKIKNGTVQESPTRDFQASRRVLEAIPNRHGHARVENDQERHVTRSSTETKINQRKVQ